jgi:hypothetical protein
MSGSALAALLISLGVVLFVVLLAVRRSVAGARSALAEIAEGRQAIMEGGANSLGVRSRGRAQVRGYGYLALFDDELVFRQAMGKNHVRARRADLLAVTTPRSHLGKSIARRLLAVEWKTAEGTDQVAFSVADLDGWLGAFERAGVKVERP